MCYVQNSNDRDGAWYNQLCDGQLVSMCKAVKKFANSSGRMRFKTAVVSTDYGPPLRSKTRRWKFKGITLDIVDAGFTGSRDVSLNHSRICQSSACVVTATATPAPMASVDLIVLAPCFRNESGNDSPQRHDVLLMPLTTNWHLGCDRPGAN